MGRVVENHFTQASADDDPDGAIKQDVVEVLDGPALIGDVLVLQVTPAQHDELRESSRIHQAIPVEGKRADFERHRIGHRVNDHARATSGGSGGLFAANDVRATCKLP